MICFLKWIQDDNLLRITYVVCRKHWNDWHVSLCTDVNSYFVLSGHYGITNLSSVMCSPYSEIVSEAHICISLSHDTARGISIGSICLTYTGCMWAVYRKWLSVLLTGLTCAAEYPGGIRYTPCPKKTKQICFCQNFVKFPPISIIFGTKMGNDPNICGVHSFSTSPNLRHHLTVLNANVPNCYITPKLLVIDRSHWRPQFIRGRRTFRDHSNFKQLVHIW